MSIREVGQSLVHLLAVVQVFGLAVVSQVSIRHSRLALSEIEDRPLHDLGVGGILPGNGLKNLHLTPKKKLLNIPSDRDIAQLLPTLPMTCTQSFQLKILDDSHNETQKPMNSSGTLG